MTDEKMVSVIVPCYNEEDGIRETILRLKKVLSESKIPYEILFVNDGSKDKTFFYIKEESMRDSKHIKGITFSRNFGKEAAMRAGLRYANGRCAVVIDSDLQQPPEIIPQMYELWKEGWEIVEGIKAERQKENLFHRFSAKAFYCIFSKAIGTDIRNASDYKLLDRKVIDIIVSLPEKETFFRGLTFWTGFKMTKITYSIQPRKSGTTKWPVYKLVKYAVHNVISFSSIPLSFITVQSILMIGLGIVFAARALRLYVTNQAAGGITTVVMLMLLIGGLILLSLSIIGQYIASIYNEVKGRPQFLVSETVGLEIKGEKRSYNETNR